MFRFAFLLILPLVAFAQSSLDVLSSTTITNVENLFVKQFFFGNIQAFAAGKLKFAGVSVPNDNPILETSAPIHSAGNQTVAQQLLWASFVIGSQQSQSYGLDNNGTFIQYFNTNSTRNFVNA